MEQREERPNLFGLSQVVTEEGEAKEEGKAKSRTISNGTGVFLLHVVRFLPENHTQRLPDNAIIRVNTIILFMIYSFFYVSSSHQ